MNVFGKEKYKNTLNVPNFEGKDSYIILESKKIGVDSLLINKLRIGNRVVCEFAEDDKYSVILDMDKGFKPVIRYADFLEKIGFTCDSAYGITDMTYIFTYNDVKYILFYDNCDDVISFIVKSNDSNVINIFRETIAKLLSIK